jgi:DNA adenine methylase
LIEPFTGSGAVFNNTDYPSYLLAEENQDLISLYQHLQAEQETFIAFCKPLFSGKNNNATQYYLLRERFNKSHDSRERAALFLYLNRHGYNGLCRYNQKGGYNVPFGQYIKPYFPEDEMRYFYQKSQQAIFIKSDFRQTFSMAKSGDVIYCDPPYAPLNQGSNFTQYTHGKFGLDEQIKLANLARMAAQSGITVLISNHDTEFVRHHYDGAKIKSFAVRRSISRNREQRKPVKEVLAIFLP